MRNAGRMNQRVTLQQKSVSRDEFGGETITWVDIATVWAEARSLTGREYLSARAERTETLVRMQMDWQPSLTTADRVVWRDVPYEIEAKLDTYGTQKEMVLMCKAVA